MPQDLRKLSQEQLDELGKYVFDKWNEFKNSPKRQQVQDRVKGARDAYHQVTTVATSPWRGAANHHFPLETITVDHMVPRFAATVVGKDPMLTLEDFGKLDKEHKELVEQFDDYVLKTDVKIQNLVDEWLEGLAIDGHKYAQIFWNYKEGKQRKYYQTQESILTEGAYNSMPPDEQPQGLFPNQGLMMYEDTVATHDGVKIKFVPLDNLKFADAIDDWEEADIFRDYYCPWHKFKQYVSNGTDGWIQLSKEELQELEDQLLDKRPDAPEEKTNEPQDTQDRRGTTEAAKLKQELFLIEGHINRDVDDDGIEEKIIVTIDSLTKKVVYIEDNAKLDPMNRKQIQPTWLFRERGTAYGYGFHHKLKEISEGASDFCNTLINSAVIAMIPWFFYEGGSGFEEQQPELEPGKGVKCKNVDKVKFPNLNANAAIFKDFLNIYLALWERVVALSDYSLGRESEVLGKKGGTATGTLAVIQEGQIAHEYRGLTIQKQFERIFEIIHDLYYLNMPLEAEIAILGQPIPKRIMSRNYKLKLTASTASANRAAERAEMMEAGSVGQQLVNYGVADPVAIGRDLLKMFRNINVDEWLNGPMSQIAGRMNTKDQEGDPFPHLVAEMLQMSPQQLVELINNNQLGAQYKQEVTQSMRELESAVS